jgi:hypothetical protein
MPLSIQDACAELSIVLQGLLADANDARMTTPLDRILDSVVLAHLAKSLQSFDASRHLIAAGFLNDAIMIIRSIEECFLQLWWILSSDTERKLNDFDLYRLVEAIDTFQRDITVDPAVLTEARETYLSKSGILKNNWRRDGTGMEVNYMSNSMNYFPITQPFGLNTPRTTK